MWNGKLIHTISYQNIENVLGGVYRHPNGNTKYFVYDLETTLEKIGDKVTVILAGDINIDLIKFDNEDTLMYLTIMMSYRYLPYITLPTRLTDFSATCIDHIFVKFSTNNLFLATDLLSGMFYCDITDHLPCFISMKVNTWTWIIVLKLDYLAKKTATNSSGPDNISKKIINFCPNIFAENLTKIFNRVIEKCEYPVQMKMDKVIALYKKGKRSQANDYRPISLLSILNKLLEKLLCRRVMKFLNANNILFKFQNGFRKLHSTTLALIEFTDSVKRFLDDGNYVISIFVDLTKAFDTVDHDILLYELDRYGIRGYANDFSRTYLTNRFQYTVINGTQSALNAVTCGVPQGSVLGPLFFALYINDIYESVGMDYVRLFADDIALYMWHKNLITLVEEIKLKLSHLYMWCVSNKLIINRDKTNFVLFHTVNRPIPTNFFTIQTEFMSIDRVPFFKYLGWH